jgi:hypothetical protein
MRGMVTFRTPTPAAMQQCSNREEPPRGRVEPRPRPPLSVVLEVERCNRLGSAYCRLPRTGRSGLSTGWALGIAAGPLAGMTPRTNFGRPSPDRWSPAEVTFGSRTRRSKSIQRDGSFSGPYHDGAYIEQAGALCGAYARPRDQRERGARGLKLRFGGLPPPRCVNSRLLGYELSKAAGGRPC